MDKQFKHENMHRLDSDERRKLVPPEAVLDLMNIQPGATLLDAGAGIGYFAIPAAARVGAGGKVIAADLSQEMLDELSRRAGEAGVAVDTVLCGADSIPLADATADLILLAFVLHEVEDQTAYLREMSRLLKGTGALTIVEWDTVASPTGPHQHERIGRPELGRLADAAGLAPVKDARINEYHYACIVKKK
jgi:ubiquinone/menaquinone biosynthesis C-methylase UbiE